MAPRKKVTKEAPEPEVLEDVALLEPLPVADPEPESVALRSAKPVFVIRITRRAFRFIALVLMLGIAFLVAARMLHWWNWGLTAAQIQQREVAALEGKIGKLMLLPTGETPVVATVTNASTLKKSQAFYQNADNGDVLMVYSKAERAILYRPSTNMIINVGPVYLNQTSGTTKATAPASTPALTHASSTTQ